MLVKCVVYCVKKEMLPKKGENVNCQKIRRLGEKWRKIRGLTGKYHKSMIDGLTNEFCVRNLCTWKNVGGKCGFLGNA